MFRHKEIMVRCKDCGGLFCWICNHGKCPDCGKASHYKRDFNSKPLREFPQKMLDKV